jgi:hypothetical protein
MDKNKKSKQKIQFDNTKFKLFQQAFKHREAQRKKDRAKKGY